MSKNGEQTEPQAVAEPTPPVTSPTPPTPGPSSTYTPVDQMVYAPDGKTWKSKFHGAEGHRTQIEEQRDTQRGALEQKVMGLEQQLREAQAQVSSLTNEVSALTEQANTIPQLQEQLTTVRQQAAEAARLRILMKHPQLLGVQIEEQRAVEGQEEPEVVQVNPYMKFIQTTTMEGDELDQALGQLTAVLAQLPSVGPVTPEPVVEGAVPQPAQPTGTTDVDSCRQEALRWHALRLAGESGPNGEDSAQMEQEAWNKMYEAQSAANT